MQRAVSALAHSIASEFVTGAGEAIDTGDENRGLKLFGNKVALGYAIALFVAFALGTAAIVLTVILVRNTRRLRNQSKEATEREAALMHIIDSLKTKNPELEADVERLLEEQLKDKD
jgi:hypothetical protein